MKAVGWFSLFSIVLCFTVVASQEPVEFLQLYEPTETLQSLARNGLPMAVQVENEHLKNVSSSVLMAEAWVRSHVLSFFPAINITSVLVGTSVNLCKKNQENMLSLLMPSIKNIYYSLTRWGLQNDIKVSVSFNSHCLVTNSEAYRTDLAENFITPLLKILLEIDSPYVVNPPLTLDSFSDEILVFVKPHLESMKKIGAFGLNKIKILYSPKKEKPLSRKLTFLDSSKIDPFPTRPTLISPSHAPSGHSAPAYAAISPLPPLIGTVPPQSDSAPFPPLVNPTTPPFTPHLAPMVSPPFGPHLPPCAPPPESSPRPRPHNGLWCVAKPSVPPETLQEALDYACGEGGADCEAISSNGSCYFPDTVVAHASYSFNSYWQKNKRNGGSCDFGGTAMLINSDPSYQHCRFILN